MTAPSPVVAVLDAAQRQRSFAAALSSAFGAAGLSLELRTQRELAAEVSIEQADGQEPAVHPDRPLLWLCPCDSGRPDTPDGRFLSLEWLAAARSIAALTHSPVLNRPSAVSSCGTFPSGSLAGTRRVRRYDAAAVRAERATGSWPDGAGLDGVLLEVYDYATRRSSYGRAAGSAGPFRYREAAVSPVLTRIRVIGDQTVAAAGTCLDMLEASRRAAAGYQLDLATVWWLTGSSNRRLLARVESWAWDTGLGGELAEVAGAVAAWMNGRLTAHAGRSR